MGLNIYIYIHIKFGVWGLRFPKPGGTSLGVPRIKH